MLNESMISSLWCPNCRSSGLRPEVKEREADRILSGQLHCDGCRADYPVVHGVPDLIPHQKLSSEEWALWKSHLEGFEARNRVREEQPDKFLNRITQRSRGLFEAFVKFADIQEGSVLDIGCGPGNFRRQLDSSKVSYCGIDPIPQDADFPFARALAEFLPFRDDAFTDVVVMSAMDHFGDVAAFLDETRRVLAPGGKLHVVQSIHDVRGPLSALKFLTHEVKDRLERRATTSASADAPKHMTEFKRSEVFSVLNERFEVLREGRFSKRWYSPDNLFLSMGLR